MVKLTQSGHYPIHSHNITDNTNNGVYPGGMHAMMMVDPAPAAVAVKLKAGSKEAAVDGKRKSMAAAPQVRDGQLYIPLPLLQETAKFAMTKGKDDIVLKMKANELQLRLGQKTAVYNGKSVKLPAAPAADKGVWLIPAKVAEQYMGATLKKGGPGEWSLTLKRQAPSPSWTEAISAATAETGTGTGTSTGTGQTGSESGHAEGHEGNAGNGHDQLGGNSTDGTTVSIDATSYTAKDLRIAAGTTVTWVNRDTQAHTVTDLDDRFDSKSIPASGRWSFTFKDKGSYLYYCSLHPTMQGTVTVE